MNFSQTLKDLGLSDQEKEAYLSLLRLGGAQASRVAADMQIKRTTVYPILKSLKQKGFALVYYRNGKHMYYAQKPANVVGLVEKKLNAFRDIVPSLCALEKTQAKQFGLRFLETKEELFQFYSEIIDAFKKRPKKDREYLVIGDSKSWLDAFSEGRGQWYWRARADAGIQTRLLLTEQAREVNTNDPTLLRDYKFLSDNFEGGVDIFDKKILIYSGAMKSLALVIEIPAMVEIFRSLFTVLWAVTPEPEDKLYRAKPFQ